MTEILTESFCERCGTRYTFESAAPRRSRIGRVRTLGRGMRNFVLSDDASFSEAMAEARSEEEIAATAHQLDAFHQTFNFCLTCRQYTCGDCWNVPEGRCLTCAPLPETVAPPIAVAAPVLDADAGDRNGDLYETEVWPDTDLPAARLARALGIDDGEDEAIGGAELEGIARAPEAAAATPPVEQPSVADASAVDASAQAPVAAITGVAPGQSLEDAIAEYEARMAADDESEVAGLAHAGLANAGVAEEAEIVGASPGHEPSDVTEPPFVAVEPADLAAAEAERAALAGQAESEPVAVAPEPEPVTAGDEPQPVIADAEPLAVAEPDTLAGAEPEAQAPGDAESPAAAAEPEPVATDTQPEPIANAADAQPEPAAAAAELEPLVPAAEPDSPSAPEPVAADEASQAAGVDVVAQPVWRQPAPAAPSAAPAPPPPASPPQPSPWLTVAPEEADGQPQWPVAPAWPAPANRRDVPTTLAGRPLLPQGDASGLWAASAREVLTAAAQAPTPTAAPLPTAQPCVSCGLSLSANARFCRRCGTRQG